MSEEKVVPGTIKRVLAKGNLSKKKAAEKLEGLEINIDGEPQINGKTLLKTEIKNGIKTFYLEGGEKFSYEVEMVYSGYKFKEGIEKNDDFDFDLDTEVFESLSQGEFDDLSVDGKIAEYSSKPKPETVSSIEEANLVTSQIEGKPGFHAPVIDFDFPHFYVESSTPGHGHLYIDQEWDEETFWLFIETLVDFGLVEPGYYGASKARGYTAVRLPWIKKGENE